MSKIILSELQVADQPDPGIYWIKWADRDLIYVNEKLSGQRWIVEDWAIAKWDGDWYEIIGSDEIYKWQDRNSFVYKVGPRVDPPAD